jgi:hypothetical protein
LNAQYEIKCKQVGNRASEDETRIRTEYDQIMCSTLESLQQEHATQDWTKKCANSPEFLKPVKKQQQHQQDTSIHHCRTIFELAVEAKITTIKQSF